MRMFEGGECGGGGESMWTTNIRTVLPEPGTKKDDNQLRTENYLLQNIVKCQNILTFKRLLRLCRPFFRPGDR